MKFVGNDVNVLGLRWECERFGNVLRMVQMLCLLSSFCCCCPHRYATHELCYEAREGLKTRVPCVSRKREFVGGQLGVVG